MQSRALLHPKVPSQAALGKEVCRELNRTAETGTDHSGSNTTVYTLHTFASIDLGQAIDRVLIVMLSPDREEGRIGLQAGLHQEEWGSGSRTNNTRHRTGENIDAEGLYLWIFIDGTCDVGANGFVEAETATVQEDLVDVLDITRALACLGFREMVPWGWQFTHGRSNTTEQSSGTFILKDNLDTVQDTPILLHTFVLRLQFTLEL